MVNQLCGYSCIYSTGLEYKSHTTVYLPPGVQHIHFVIDVDAMVSLEQQVLSKLLD
jgi:hypothetical protein